MQLLLFVAIGLLIGFIAEPKMKKKGYRLPLCLTISVIGSVFGGWATGSLSFESLHDQAILSFGTSFAGSIMMVSLGYLVSNR